MICEAADSLIEMDRATKEQAANRTNLGWETRYDFRTRNYSLERIADESDCPTTGRSEFDSQSPFHDRTYSISNMQIVSNKKLGPPGIGH